MKNVVSNYRRVTGVPAARRLLAADAVSKAGDWVLYVAMSTLVFEAGGAGALAIFSALRIGIPFVLGPWAGRWGGALPARTVMIIADLARALCLVLAAVVASTGSSVWLLEFIVIACAMVTAVHAPAERRLQRDAVEERMQPDFNAVLGALGTTVIVVAPAVGGLVIVAVGNVGALLVDAASYLVSAAFVMSVRVAATRPAATGATATETSAASPKDNALATALRAARSDSAVLASLGTQAVACTVAGACLVLMPLLADSLPGGTGAVGWLTAALGVGSVVGGLLGGVVARSGRLVLAVSSIVVMGVVLGLLGTSANLAVALTFAALAGLTANIPEPLYWTTYAARVEEADSSAFYGLVESAITGGFALGGLALGALVTMMGTSPAAWTIGLAGSALSAVALIPALRHRARLVQTGSPATAETRPTVAETSS